MQPLPRLNKFAGACALYAAQLSSWAAGERWSRPAVHADSLPSLGAIIDGGLAARRLPLNMQCPLIFLSPLVDDLRRDGTLAAHRVDGHHRAVQLQRNNSGIAADLSVPGTPRRDHMDRPLLGGAMIIVNRYPGDETTLKLLRVQPRKHVLGRATAPHRNGKKRRKNPTARGWCGTAGTERRLDRCHLVPSERRQAGTLALEYCPYIDPRLWS